MAVSKTKAIYILTLLMQFYFRSEFSLAKNNFVIVTEPLALSVS